MGMSKRHRPSVVAQKITADAAEIDEDATYLAFSFRHMDEHLWKRNNKEERAALAKRIFQLSRKTLRDIHSQSRQGFGMEKIKASQLAFSIPSGLDEESAGFPVSFKYGQGKRSMVGVRVGATFYILCVEHTFGDAYDHGGS